MSTTPTTFHKLVMDSIRWHQQRGETVVSMSMSRSQASQIKTLMGVMVVRSDECEYGEYTLLVDDNTGGRKRYLHKVTVLEEMDYESG